MQGLLRRADWDVDGVRDNVRDYVIGEHCQVGVFLASFSAHGTHAATCSGCFAASDLEEVFITFGLTCADGMRLAGCPQVKRVLPT
jgi:hypothetical protein